MQAKRRKQVEASSAFLANLQRFSTLISKKTNLLSIKGNEEKEKRSEFRGFVMVIGPSRIQFGLQLYQEFPKLDDTESSYQLIKTKIPFEKETRHRLYFSIKEEKKQQQKQQQQLTRRNARQHRAYDAFYPPIQA